MTSADLILFVDAAPMSAFISNRATRLVQMLWSALATKLTPLIRGMQARYRGSALERQYADADASKAELCEAFAQLRSRLLDTIGARG